MAVALEDVDGAVDVARPRTRSGVAAVLGPSASARGRLGDLVNSRATCLDGLDVAGERDRPPHRRRCRLEGVLGGAALGQPVPAADDLGGVVELELAVAVGELLLERLGDRSSSTARTSTL